MQVTLRPVTNRDDLPTLCEIHMKAVAPDPLVQWVERYTTTNEYDNTMKALTESFDDPQYSIVKAVLVTTDTDGQELERIVGFVHWLEGYIQLEKVDPFALKEAWEQSQRQQTMPGPQQELVVDLGNSSSDMRDPASTIAEDIASRAEQLRQKPQKTTEEEDRAARLVAGDAVFTDSRNGYIMAIRGKKHMYIRRLMVDPAFQRRGIASKMLKHVTDKADAQKIVCWLFSRPAGETLYRKVGFKEMRSTDMSIGDFYCPPVLGMMRLANPT